MSRMPLDAGTLAQILDAVDLGIVGLAEDQVVYANERAVGWLGAPIEVSRLRAAMAGAQVDVADVPRFEAARHFRIEDRILGFSLFRTGPLPRRAGREADGPTEWVLLRDITERLWLRRTTESLVLVDNLGFALAGITHELGNPINAVLMAASLLLERAGAGEDPSYPREILEAALRMQEILRVMQGFVRTDALRPTELDVRAACGAFGELVRLGGGRRGVAVRFDFEARDPDPLPAVLDPAALRQVLLNLFSNACDAVEGRHPAVVALDAWGTPGRVHLSMSDNGCGMSEAQQQRLFVPFGSTKASGTGFGLVIVKKLVTLMGGTVEVTSTPGVGSRFELVFPAVAAPAAERTP
jgi:signal transduction histidine kinase